MPRSPERIVLVTGAAGGMGAEVARRLAAVDSHVIVNYRDDAARADSIAAAISNAGGHASTLGGDIFDEAGAAAMIGSVAARFGRLDTVILNASGGIDLGGDAAHARHLNREAQRRLSLLAMPLMPAGGRIVFVTSHQAHFFPHKAVPKGYAVVAASEYAGETALYALRSEFDRNGLHFSVVSGDMIDRGHSPVCNDFAAAIVTAATAPNPPGVVYVGGADCVKAA